MSRDWAAWAMTAGVIASIAGVLCLGALWRMRRVFLERQRELEERVSTLDEAVRTLESCLAELGTPGLGSARLGTAGQGTADLHAASGSEAGEGPADEAAAEDGIGESIEREIQAALAVAAMAAAGPKARLLSAREIKVRGDVSAWSQQGRVLVQGSHNLRRGRD